MILQSHLFWWFLFYSKESVTNNTKFKPINKVKRQLKTSNPLILRNFAIQFFIE